LLVEAWTELAKEKRFDVVYTPFMKYGAYSTPRMGGFPVGAQEAPKEVWRNAGKPGSRPLKRKYFVPVVMVRKNSIAAEQ
jgi:hypothetical protein